MSIDTTILYMVSIRYHQFCSCLVCWVKFGNSQRRRKQAKFKDFNPIFTPGANSNKFCRLSFVLCWKLKPLTHKTIDFLYSWIVFLHSDFFFVSRFSLLSHSSIKIWLNRRETIMKSPKVSLPLLLFFILLSFGIFGNDKIRKLLTISEIRWIQ